MQESNPSDIVSQPLKRPSLKNAFKLAAQVGIAGGKVMLGVIGAFGVANFLLIGYAIFRVFKQGFSWGNMGVLTLSIMLGVVCTLIGCYLTYRYVLLLVIKKVYALTLGQRSKISEDVIRRAAHIFNGQEQVSQAQLSQAINWSVVVHRCYRSTPEFFQSGITQYVNRIPITRFIIELKEDILADRQQLAAEKLRVSVDDFFENNILGAPSNFWAWLLWCVNIIALYVLITWGIVPV